MFGTILFVLFLGFGRAKAATDSVIINEIMTYPVVSITGEFIELYNNGPDTVDLTTWYLKDNTSKDTFILFTKKDFGQAADFKLKTKSHALILDPDYATDYDDFLTKHFKSGDLILTVANTSLGNGLSETDEVTIYNEKDEIIDQKVLSGTAGQNYSWERKSASSTQFLISREPGGTPGAENSVTNLLPPTKPELLTPSSNQQLAANTAKIDFTWSGANAKTYTFLLAKDKDLKDTLSEEELKTNTISLEKIPAGIYFWQVVASNEEGDASSEIFQFEILAPVYSKSILVNEIMPDPEGDETANEWIELYNNSDEDVDLSDWQLTDRNGTIKKFTIKENIIRPRGFACFTREDTGITLNNDKDGASLFQPDGNLLVKSPQFTDGSEGWSWARGSSGKWVWTTKPTKCYANKIRVPTEEDPVGGESIAVISLSGEPIPIKTGEYSSYSQQLVKILGKVTETSGSTFYLDDGTGRAKVYIQAKTNIQKPPMHKGDTFLVTGIVNLFRQVWRILPQKQEDVQLVSLTDGSLPFSDSEESAPKSSAKKVAAPVMVAAKPSSQFNIIKEVKAAENKNLGPLPAAEEQTQNNLLIQIAKLMTGLALIFLVILVIKVIKYPKPIVIGGNFGRDDT